MPRQIKCSYQISSSSGTQGSPLTAESSPGGSGNYSHVSQTSSGSSMGTSGGGYGPGQYPSDGCPYTEIVDGATWEGKLVLFPNGRRKLWPQQSSNDLHEIFKLRRELPGQGGEKWSTLKAKTKHFYFDELRGSIANELYSGILQPTSFEQDKNIVVTQTDDKLQETDPGDSWYDDGSSSEGHVEKSQSISYMDREWQKRHDQFHTIGYRDGLLAGKEFAAQEGFNIGFKDSVSTGYNWGLVRGVASAMACLPGGLKEKLVESEDTRNKFQLLHESVQAISTTDALKLFYEDHKRKSAEQNDGAEASSTSADLKHQNNDSIFNNYSGQLRSILNDSPLIGVHLEISK